MAITQAMCTSFKKRIDDATHNFATNGNAFKLALYAIGSGGKSSTTATLRSRIYGVCNNWRSSFKWNICYWRLALTKVAPTSSGTTAFTDFGDRSFTTATITARGALIYNDTNGNKGSSCS